MTTNLGTLCFVFFNEYAKRNGFTKKVVGAYAWRNARGYELRLVSAITADKQVVVYDSFKMERYNIGWPQEN